MNDSSHSEKMEKRKEEQSILDGCITIPKHRNIHKFGSKEGVGVEY